jgi:hypothetical protein
MAQATLKSNTSQPHPHHIRTFFAAICGIIALVLIFASILVVWLNQTLTNTQLFVQTLAPLAKQQDVQNFIATKATDALINDAPTKDLAGALMPDKAKTIATTPDDQLKPQLQSTIHQDMLPIVQSPVFASLWRQTLTSAHAQFLTQLNSNSPTITLDLRPAINGTIDLLRTTNLHTISDKIELKNDSGIVTLKGDKLPKIRQYYHWFQEGTLGIATLTLLAAGLCIALSVHHIRTLRRILLGTGIIALVIAAALRASSFIPVSSDPLQRKAAIAIITTLFHNLQLGCLILGGVCIVLSIGSKLLSLRRAG